MDSWIPILFNGLQSVTTIYFGLWGSPSSWLSCPLEWWASPSFFESFLTLVLESAMSVRTPNSFSGESNHVVGRILMTKGILVLMTRTYKYAILHCKGTLQMWLRIMRWGRIFWTRQALNVITRIIYFYFFNSF